MSDDPLASCVTCGASVQRVFHPVAVHFKGSGFYNTDYGKTRGRGGEETTAESNTGSSSGSDKQNDSSQTSESSSGSSDSSSGSSQSSSGSSSQNSGNSRSST
jgi:predicted nucleic acid-binding Zn ribbon protein